MDAFLEDLAILGDHGTTAAHMDLDLKEFTQTEDDLLDLVGQFTGRSQNETLGFIYAAIDELESGNGKSSSLAHTGLGLGNGVSLL
jgi:hypothetical protein